MKTVTMLDFRRHAATIIRRGAAGERMVLSYRGKPVFRLEPMASQDDASRAHDPFYGIVGIATQDKHGALAHEEIDRLLYR
jgi:prevent-host-death family protein